MAANPEAALAEWKPTLERFMWECKTHSLPRLLNRLGYHISMAANKLTPTAKAEDITAAVGIIGYGIERTTSKRAKRAWKKTKAIYAQSSRAKRPGPLLAIMINAARGKRGEKGLYGGEMKEAVNTVIHARQGAKHYLQSGWLPAVAGFAQALGLGVRTKPRNWKSGRSVGGFKAATQGWTPKAELSHWAAALPGHTHQVDAEIAERAKAGLEAAIRQNTAWMEKQIEKEMQRTVDSMTRRFFR